MKPYYYSINDDIQETIDDVISQFEHEFADKLLKKYPGLIKKIEKPCSFCGGIMYAADDYDSYEEWCIHFSCDSHKTT